MFNYLYYDYLIETINRNRNNVMVNSVCSSSDSAAPSAFDLLFPNSKEPEYKVVLEKYTTKQEYEKHGYLAKFRGKLINKKGTLLANN